MADPTAEVATIIRGILYAHCIDPAADEIQPESYLRELGLDCLDLQSLACALDEHFEIYLSDDAIAGWERVADVIASVQVLMREKA